MTIYFQFSPMFIKNDKNGEHIEFFLLINGALRLEVVFLQEKGWFFMSSFLLTIV
jgi:hypothetical protein